MCFCMLTDSFFDVSEFSKRLGLHSVSNVKECHFIAIYLKHDFFTRWCIYDSIHVRWKTCKIIAVNLFRMLFKLYRPSFVEDITENT